MEGFFWIVWGWTVFYFWIERLDFRLLDWLGTWQLDMLKKLALFLFSYLPFVLMLLLFVKK